MRKTFAIFIVFAMAVSHPACGGGGAGIAPGGALAYADGADTARSAIRGYISNTTSNGAATVPQTRGTTAPDNRTTNTTARTTETRSATAAPRTVATRDNTTTDNVTTRSATNVVARTETTGGTLSQNRQLATSSGTRPTANTTAVRTAVAPITRPSSTIAARTTTATMPTLSRTAMPAIARTGETVVPQTRGTGRPTGTVARAATTDTVVGAPVIPDSSAYQTCHDTYFSCMDELCANKDTQLRRCACSARVHDFDAAKQNLTKISDAMNQFNTNLLTVSMDGADSAATINATAGEDAYNNTTDSSASQNMLDDISKKLNTNPADTSIKNQLASISFSMNTADTDPFDSIDMTLGANAADKTGVDLYNAATPMCKQIAAEACQPADIQTVMDAYQMAIDADCNTVKNTYAALTDTAKQKVLDANSLLDMSRLDNYQTRNSDDILTCKSKMLTMLSDDSVCGTDLSKCLDWSGKYINPATGEAILGPDLSKLTDMLTRPTAGQKWVNVPGNQSFVNFLDSKKTYLEPAIKNCESIADDVWDSFMEDALAQIALAQSAKLETVRQSCTTLTTDCLTASGTSLDNFDSRALSVFGLAANQVSDQTCSDIKNSCTALLGGTDENGNPVGDWGTGMDDISTATTYQSMKLACGQVGQNCIVANCTNINGKFGLCMNGTDPVREQLISRYACFDDVKSCVASAGDKLVTQIVEQNDDLRKSVLADDTNTCNSNDNTCIIAESIWGACNVDSNNPEDAQIIMDQSGGNAGTYYGDSLLAWLATNTKGIDGEPQRACTATICIGDTGMYPGPNYNGALSACISKTSSDLINAQINNGEDAQYCPVADYTQFKPTNYLSSANVLQNCCLTDNLDAYDNCCANGVILVDGVRVCRVDNNNTMVNVMNYTIDIRQNRTTADIMCTGGMGFDDDQGPNCTGGFFTLDNGDDTTAGTELYYPLVPADSTSSVTTATDGTPMTPSVYFYGHVIKDENQFQKCSETWHQDTRGWQLTGNNCLNIINASNIVAPMFIGTGS